MNIFTFVHCCSSSRTWAKDEPKLPKLGLRPRVETLDYPRVDDSSLGMLGLTFVGPDKLVFNIVCFQIMAPIISKNWVLIWSLIPSVTSPTDTLLTTWFALVLERQVDHARSVRNRLKITSRVSPNCFHKNRRINLSSKLPQRMNLKILKCPGSVSFAFFFFHTGVVLVDLKPPPPSVEEG